MVRMEACESETAKLAKMKDRLSALRLDLDALDRGLGLHEIPIDPSTIPTIRVTAVAKIRIRK